MLESITNNITLYIEKPDRVYREVPYKFNSRVTRGADIVVVCQNDEVWIIEAKHKISETKRNKNYKSGIKRQLKRGYTFFTNHLSVTPRLMGIIFENGKCVRKFEYLLSP